MVRSLLFVLPLLAAACSASQAESPSAHASPADAWIQYGAPFTLASAVPASAVLSDPASHVGKVRMTGELTEVCQKMGCWAVVRDDAGHSVRITMKDHAFGIDQGGAGRKVELEGELVKKAVDPEQVAHYKSEGSAHPPEEGKTETYEVVATTVWVARS
jgi:hypothetical protein